MVVRMRDRNRGRSRVRGRIKVIKMIMDDHIFKTTKSGTINCLRWEMLPLLGAAGQNEYLKMLVLVWYVWYFMLLMLCYYSYDYGYQQSSTMCRGLLVWSVLSFLVVMKAK